MSVRGDTDAVGVYGLGEGAPAGGAGRREEMEGAVRVLITGAAGFIGSACAVALRARGDEVVGLDSFDETLYARPVKERTLAWARHGDPWPLVEGDVRDSRSIGQALERGPFDAVLHLGAVAGVRPSLRLAPRYFDVNVTGTLRLVEAARAAGVERFVLASSSSVYGGNQKVPFAEDDRVDAPMSPYAASKAAMELAVRADQRLHGGHVTCLRFFTVYGPRQRPDMAIHKFLRLVAADAPIPLFGDGSSGRDYTYIDDIVAGVLAALDRPRGFRVYNLGGDRVVRLDALVEAVGRTAGRTPKIAPQPMPPGDVPLTHADLSRARDELGYAPRTPLEEGLRKTWAWLQGEPAPARRGSPGR